MAVNDTATDITRLHRLVDDLAMHLVLDGPRQQSGDGRPAWLQLLSELEEAAASLGVDGLANAAARTRERLISLDVESQEFADAAQTGIQTLQEVLEARRSAAEARTAASTNSIAQDPELIADFIMESRAHLETIEQMVLALEQDPTSLDPIHAVFRAFHTIKGIAGFLELQDIREVSHETETLLDEARNGNLEVGSQVIDVILESADYLNREITRIEGGGREQAVLIDKLLAKLRDTLRKHGKQQADSGIAALSQAVADPNPSWNAPPPSAAKPEPSVAPTAPAPEAAPEAAAAKAAGPKTATISSIKVDTAKLDFLIDMVGEMVIAQSLVRHNPDMERVQSASLLRNVAQLSRITNEVQKTAMSMRMVPIGVLFQKMTRLVRDLCKKSGKQAELVPFGEDTELDRNIVEELADPLMHMVRNAVDHGIEPPKDRIAAGKP